MTALCNRIIEIGHKKGWMVVAETNIPTAGGVRKRDMIVYNDVSAWVIDTTVCADNANLYDVPNRKVICYTTNEIRTWVNLVCSTCEVEFSSVTMNWGGGGAIWHHHLKPCFYH